MKRLHALDGPVLLVLLSLSLSGCMEAYRKSVVGQTPQVFTRLYLTDFETAWIAVKESLKSVRIDVDNKDGGLIQTRWTDNTQERNFKDSFGPTEVFLQAQYRLKIVVSPGAHDGRTAVKVSIQKDQVVKKDALEGWQPIETDGVEENALLYRIARLIFIKIKLDEIENAKKAKALEDTRF